MAGLGLAALALLPVVPSRAGATTAAPAVFAAGAEAWAYSVEVGVPGPLGPLASHTTVAVDNSPHAQGAAGLADPGYLIRAAAQLVAGVPTPAYCESAWPEGPDHADCGAPGGAAAVSRTTSGAAPDAMATAGLGQIAVPGAGGAPRVGGSGGPALTVAAQSTMSQAALGADGLLHARADVNLSGIAVAGGALRIGTLALHREAAAGALPGGAQTTAGVSLGDVTVAGKPVEPGGDAVRGLAQAARQAFGDKLVVEGLSGTQQQTPDGKLVADSAGLQITWRPAKDRSVRIVLGYGRVLVYATAPLAAPVAAPGDLSAPGAGGAVPATSSEAPPPAGGGGTAAVSASASSLSPGSPANAVTLPPEPPGVTSPGPGAGGVSSAAQSAAAPAASAAPGEAAVPGSLPLGRPLAAAARRPVRWVSPFLVLAQMTTGRQAWWFLLALVPLLGAAWLSRRSGLGLVAPWSRP